eukprot:105055_1
MAEPKSEQHTAAKRSKSARIVPQPDHPAKMKPAKSEKQLLRQQKVIDTQRTYSKHLDESQKPVQMPIQDKYIFGLANKRTENEVNEPNNSEEEEFDYNSRFAPRKYSEIWEKQEIITTSSGGNFCCYSTGTSHNNLVFVCLHGCGHSALSYSLVANLIKHKYQIFSFDYRGHGYTEFPHDENDAKTTDNDDNHSTAHADKSSIHEYYTRHFNPGSKAQNTGNTKEYEMSKDSLVKDIIEVVNAKYGVDDPPPIVLVGHSLGGALAVHTAQVKGMDGIPSLVGIVVIDLVEGTALNSLIHMRSIINRRPKSFDTMEKAIRYCVTSGMIKNYKSAQYSIPPMFVENKKGKYEWRTHVLLSEPFWREWFIGLSGLFLKSPCAKMLMLADTDRLDKPLTIGQMQGKYELCIVGCGVGHTLHEDAPKKVADKLLHFVDRNQFIKLWKVNKKFKLKKNKPK